MDPLLALALAVAQVAVNEAGFDSPADVALVAQVTEAHGSTPAERLRWLRRHSARVLGTRACRGNCRWTRGLAWGPQKPPGWPAGARWAPGRWEAVRALSWRLVSGEEAWRPCDGRPLTWGGPADHLGAVRRGLRRLSCKGTRNGGYARRAGALEGATL